MTKGTFKNKTGDSTELFLINIIDKIPENHPVRPIDSVVNNLDINDLINMYLGGGCLADHPKMINKLLFYSHLSNIYSCRKIAKSLSENIHFVFISGNSTPDFRTNNILNALI